MAVSTDGKLYSLERDEPSGTLGRGEPPYGQCDVGAAGEVALP